MCSSNYKNIAAGFYCVWCLILLGLAFAEIAFALFSPIATYIGILACVPTFMLASLIAMGLWMESRALLSITIFLTIVTIGRRLEI